MVEYFDVVDEQNNIVGRATRDECHTKGLWHRAVHILIVNSKNEILLQKRSMQKDLYKGYWIDAAAGHVDSGEIYEEAAERELKEELGITVPLHHLFDFKKAAGNDKEFIRVFAGKHEGLFNFNREEIDRVEFFTLDEIQGMLDYDKFTPATVEIVNRLAADPSTLKRFLQ